MNSSQLKLQSMEKTLSTMACNFSYLIYKCIHGPKISLFFQMFQMSDFRSADG